jgi:type II secretion system (T2SS) protein G
MTELDHDKRSLERATYTPIQRPAERVPQRDGRSWDKWTYVAGLRATASEAAAVVRRLTSGRGALTGKPARDLRKIARLAVAEVEAPSASTPLERVSEFSDLSPDLLLRFGEELAQLREDELGSIVGTVEKIAGLYSQQPPPSAQPTPAPQVPRGLKLDRSAVVAAIPGAQVFRVSERKALPAAARARARGAEFQPAPETKGLMVREEAFALRPVEQVPQPATITAPSELPVGELLDWAVRENVQATLATEALVHVSTLAAGTLSVQEYSVAAHVRVSATKDLNHFFAERLRVEPVGLLHLERVSFIPAGIERGDLVHSVPLSPDEEVNISHKEWSNTSEEFERIVTDFIEAYSEEGVTEKSELTQSTSSQIQHSSGFNLGVTASGGYGPVSISTTVGFNVSDSASNSQQASRNETNEITRKASARTKKEHKMSFKVASAAGTEDQEVRKIKNPFADRATRVDYYQLIRKWRVDLYRYGVRLTYDLTIPEPGSDILTKILQIQALQAAIQQGFNAPDSTLPWARFDLTPNQVRRDNFESLAAQYGVVVEPPPVDSYSIVKQFVHSWPNKDAAQQDEYITFTVDVPDTYEINAYGYSWQRWAWEDEDWHFDLFPNLDSWLGRWGTLEMAAGTRYVSAFEIDLTLTVQLRGEAFDAWQMRVWGTLREAAEARYELNRTMLKDQLAKLLEELGAQDALSLRKVEREEVMKGVLRWLFGPTFTFVPAIPPNLYGSNQSVINDATWGAVLAQGEIIKFLHHAIEWENMLYFLYPYFWSHTSRWEFKKYLDHPDFMHRAFLKSGSARVVLTIRPGFERDFVSFLETGTFNGLPPGHPYLTIAEEMEAFAKTNYPGIRPANPEEGARPLLSPLQKKAWHEMEGIIALLEQYKTANGAYPTTAQGLGALAGLGTVPAADPWGHPYQYTSPGTVTDFELASLGADGAVGGEDESADITSWAEASLIGRWYDYTPTSALDIAFNETLPTA